MKDEFCGVLRRGLGAAWYPTLGGVACLAPGAAHVACLKRHACLGPRKVSRTDTKPGVRGLVPRAAGRTLWNPRL